MVSISNTRTLHRIHAARQRRRWRRRTWERLIGLRPRLGITAAYRDIRNWLETPRETLP